MSACTPRAFAGCEGEQRRALARRAGSQGAGASGRRSDHAPSGAACHDHQLEAEHVEHVEQLVQPERRLTMLDVVDEYEATAGQARERSLRDAESFATLPHHARDALGRRLLRSQTVLRRRVAWHGVGGSPSRLVFVTLIDDVTQAPFASTTSDVGAQTPIHAIVRIVAARDRVRDRRRSDSRAWQQDPDSRASRLKRVRAATNRRSRASGETRVLQRPVARSIAQRARAPHVVQPTCCGA